MPTVKICQYMDWDSNHFGYRIAKALIPQITTETISLFEVWCREHHIDCLYLLLEADNPDAIHLAESAQCHLMDMRLTLKWKIPPDFVPETAVSATSQCTIRLSQPQDIPALQAIARASYTTTRFFFDPHLSTAACQELYACWIKNICLEKDTAVWIAENNQQIPLAYLSCHVDNTNHQGSIGLVGVAPQAQGQGLGTQLLRQALGWFVSQNLSDIRVITQGNNLGAQRLYQRHGFLSHRIQLWYHRWFL